MATEKNLHRPPADPGSFERALRKRTSQGKALLIGGGGFEDRVQQSLREINRVGSLDALSVVWVDYPEKRYVDETGRQFQRPSSSLDLEELMGVRHLTVVEANSTSALTFRQELRATVTEQAIEGVDLLVDISALSRASLMGLASCIIDDHWLSKARSVSYIYSAPISYDPKGTASNGWSRIVVAPIGSRASLGNEGSSLGIVVLGHEGERLSAAISEFAPARVFAYVIDTASAPEFRQIALVRNRSLLKWWRLRNFPVDQYDISETARLCDSLRKRLEMRDVDLNAPLILYPFGPKTTCLAAALLAYEMKPYRSWFVYPIPTSYSSEHSSGVRRVSLLDENLAVVGSKLV